MSSCNSLPIQVRSCSCASISLLPIEARASSASFLSVTSKHDPIYPAKVPSGETQCDIWTLARDPLFCDDPPTYIKMPRSIRDHWPDYADRVRELCIAAIEKRHTQRFYIRWLEDELRKLAKTSRAENLRVDQLWLPFVV